MTSRESVLGLLCRQLAHLLLTAFLCASAATAGAAPQTVNGTDEADLTDEYEGLPPGDGQDVVYAVCSGCHSVKLVTQQGLSRDSWDETLVWMVEEQGMAELDEETHELVLDYLAAHLGPGHRPAHVRGGP